MNGERIEKTRAWSIPVLLAVITVLLAGLGTASVRTLDRVEAAVLTLRTELTAELRKVAADVRTERDTNLKQDGEITALQVRRGP